MIKDIQIQDLRFPLADGNGSDAMHRDPTYSYAVTKLIDDGGITGCGFAFTLGRGNDLVCKVAKFYAQQLMRNDIEELMANFGEISKKLANEQQYRWLGPDKGVVQLALASVTNACYDLWAKKRGVPLWKLLIDLSPEDLLNTLDLTYLEDELIVADALKLLYLQQTSKPSRMSIIDTGYPGYDTSIGWFNYSDEQVRENCKKALQEGFTAMKLKVGSQDPERDVRRACLLRHETGCNVKIMLDANQRWTLPEALTIGKRLQAMNPYWIEEPTHPDDIRAHAILAQELAPTKIAMGEHVPNRILFKNYLQHAATSFVQVDAVRVAGVSEFLSISLLAKKFEIPVVPHVGDMGQLHQHLVLFNHISLGHQALFLEHIPHLRKQFKTPATIKDGVYLSPQEPGSSCDFCI